MSINLKDNWYLLNEAIWKQAVADEKEAILNRMLCIGAKWTEEIGILDTDFEDKLRAQCKKIVEYKADAIIKNTILKEAVDWPENEKNGEYFKIYKQMLPFVYNFIYKSAVGQWRKIGQKAG